MDGFKVPQNIPQDLLLIQEFIGVPHPTPKPQQEDDIDSSDSETVSEDEIAADLIKGTDEDNSAQIVEKTLEPCDSSSETDSLPDEDSASELEDPDHISRNNHLQEDDDEDPVPNASSGTYFQTKHEVAESDIVIPKVDRIDPDEVLEKVGEVMNIVDRVVIIKGNPSNMLNRGSDRALDSDTLLVFDDRTVMGYVYETFGPTAQPLYQVKFDSTFPLDLERVKIGREVFHVPRKSHFVFVSQIKALKGSDASNVHDEEPADDELEFSDDEAEAAYRSRLKRKRGESRSHSRQSTPNPSQMRDQELADEMYLSRNAYDAHGPYDVDFDSAAGPSRPLPIPYDDPYGEDYTSPVAESSSTTSASSFDSKPFFGRSSGSGRGYDRGGHHGRGRGRGRGRDRGGQRGRGGRGGSGYRSPQQHMDAPTELDDSQSRNTRPLTPTSFAIARATGQVAYNASQHQEQQQQSFSPMYPDALGNGSSWGYNHVQSQAQFQPQYGYLQQLQQAHMQAPLVQPHINPRFASAFGIAINAMQQLNQMPSTVQQQHSPQNATTHPTVGVSGSPNLAPTGNNDVPGSRSSFHWTDEWRVDRNPDS